MFQQLCVEVGTLFWRESSSPAPLCCPALLHSGDWEWLPHWFREDNGSLRWWSNRLQNVVWTVSTICIPPMPCNNFREDKHLLTFAYLNSIPDQSNLSSFCFSFRNDLVVCIVDEILSHFKHHWNVLLKHLPRVKMSVFCLSKLNEQNYCKRASISFLFLSICLNLIVTSFCSFRKLYVVFYIRVMELPSDVW